MDKISQCISAIFEDYKNDTSKIEECITKIKSLYFEDIGFAKIDHHRTLRRDFPEVIYGMGKTKEQILEIAQRMLHYSNVLLVTKTNKEVYTFLNKKIENLYFNEQASFIYTVPDDLEDDLKDGIILICAGTSDVPIAEEAFITAYLMGNRVQKIYDVGVAGIHRLLNYKEELYKANVIIAVAGMDGALPGVVSSLVNCPVIGVPTSIGYGASLNGLAPLLTMLNSCSPGLSLVNIDNGFGGGYCAGIINRKITQNSEK